MKGFLVFSRKTKYYVEEESKFRKSQKVLTVGTLAYAKLQTESDFLRASFWGLLLLLFLIPLF